MENAILLHNAHWQNKAFQIPIERVLLSKLLQFHNEKEIQIISGLRRSGKSSLLKLYLNHIIKTEDPTTALFINFDDPSFSKIYKHPEHIHVIIETAEKLTQTKIKYLFLDEIQAVVGWETYVKSVYDAERFKKICITGSNSSLLSGNYAQLLSGRYIAHHLYPLSIAEVLKYKKLQTPLEQHHKKSELSVLLDSILKFGSFPEIVQKKEEYVIHELLINYYDSILIKDCIVNKNIRDHKSFKETAFYIFNNLGAPYSYSSLSKAIGINEVTIKEYIQAMQEAFIVYEVSQFSFKLKQQIRSKRKLYAVDNGLIHAISLNFSENKGQLFENLVFNEMIKSGYKEIYIYNDTRECDFIIRKGRKLIAVQAVYQLNEFNIERELKGIQYVQGVLPISAAAIVTMVQHDKTETAIEMLTMVNFSNWLQAI